MTSYKRDFTLTRSTAASRQKNTEYCRRIPKSSQILATLEQAVGDELVDRHRRIDVFVDRSSLSNGSSCSLWLSLVDLDQLLQLPGVRQPELFGLDDDGVCAEAEHPALDLDGRRKLEPGEQPAVAFFRERLTVVPD
jgi:hypothetical protein